MFRLAILLILCLVFDSAGAADVRLALVIGNSKYVEFGNLDNPTNDAKGIDKALKELGYNTRLVLDANESTMRREVKRFASASQGADVALVYYAGHGSQVSGDNYLLPTDLETPRTETDIQLSSIKVDDIVNSLRSKIKILLLDACRDNPSLAKNLVKGRGTFRGGLAPISSSIEVGANEGVFIAYATDAGSVASDGTGSQNSPFTAALLRNIKEPLSIDDMFSLVTRDVRKSTANKQRPYKYASLEGVFCIPLDCSRRTEVARAAPLDSPVTNRRLDLGFKFIAEDRWSIFAEDKKAVFLLDFKSIETNNSRRKVSTLMYKFAADDDPTSAFFLDSYTKSEIAIDCQKSTSFIAQNDIYNNKYEIVSTFFIGDWKSVNISQPVGEGTVLQSLKSIVCDNLLPPKLSDEKFLEKFWSSTYDIEEAGIAKKAVMVFYYDKNSIISDGDRGQVFVRVSNSQPFSVIPASNVNYREMTEISNTYKISRNEKSLRIDCKENVVEDGISFNYSDKLSTPINAFPFSSEKIIPMGNYDRLKKIVCKDIK